VLPTIIYAQKSNKSSFKVSGDIIEMDSNQPLEYATISFLNQDGDLVAGGISDEKGHYKISVPRGIYNIQYDYISYRTVILKNQKISKSTSLPDVKMQLDSESLDEVVVRAENTEVQIRLDKKIYNIGKDLTTSGATVSDALGNIPSVTVDVDGTINLRGNENVRILINGKPSAIAGYGDAESLKQLPAEAIERVEVITSPSARYDAEGTAGILNIILRKEKALGLNASVMTSIGAPLSTGFSGNVNLRTDKFNIFNSMGYRYRNRPGNALFENQYFSPEIENPLVTEEREYDRFNKGFNVNLGIEYFINEKSSVTASGFYRRGDDDDDITNITNEFSSNNVLAITRNRLENELEEDENFQLSLTYIINFNTDGHKLTADFQYETDGEDKTSLIVENNTYPEMELLPSEEIISIEDGTDYLAQIDYVLPIGENAEFEAGFRGKFRKTTTDYTLSEEIGTSGVFIKNDSLSNLFTYEENTNALYSQYGNKLGDFSFLLGLRMENTVLIGNVTGEDLNTDNDDEFTINFDKDYLNLFPTVNLVYEFNESENISLGYNRRINRPRHWFINPFPSRSSEANVFQGNPNLDPAFASAFDLGYLKRWGKLTLTSSVYYQYETDSFTMIREDTGELTSNGIPIIRTLPINLSTNKRYGFEAGVLFNPNRWLRLNGSFNIYRFVSEGEFNNVDYGTEDTSWFTRLSSKVVLPAKFEWQTNLFYRGPRSNAQSKYKGMFSLNLAFSKDIMKDNGTITFNARDLLNSRKRKSITETETFFSDTEFQWRERQLLLSFTYRFNQKKKKERGQRNGGNGGDMDFQG
jgi:outer membrane cobalamin receptor